MEKKYVLGVDISKKKLDVCLLKEKEVLLQKCITNTLKDILRFLESIKEEYPVEFSSLLICAEHTGMYSYPLINATEILGANLWMEDPAQIKYSSGISKGKNDKADARKIALYAYRFKDKQKRYTSLDKEIRELKLLQSERAILIQDKAKYKGQINDQQEFMQSQIFLSKKKRLLSIIKSYEKAIKDIDLQINQIISNNKRIQRQFTLLKTVEGVGDKVALKMIILTGAFSLFKDHRKFASHAGVVPFAYLSGSSCRSKNKLSNRADKTIKSLLHLAALSILSKKDSELKRYYLRKVAEGKNKMAVINAIRAKIVARMFAVIKQDKEYQLFYQDSFA